jgi:outer membrane protein TolC
MTRATVLAVAATLAFTPAAGAQGSLATATTLFAQPQQAGSMLLTLEEALARGLQASHRLAELQARGEAAQAVTDQRHAAKLPGAFALAGYLRTNHIDEFGVPIANNQLRVIYPDVPNNYRARLDLQWPIYTAGRLDALERAARSEAAAWQDDVAAARADLRLEITRAYWALVTAIEAVRVVEVAVDRANAHLRDLRNQFNVGLVPPNDVASLEAQAAREQMLIVQAGIARDSANAELARLIDAPPGTAIVPASTLGAADRDLSELQGMSLGALIDEGLANRADRAALSKRATGAEERRTAAATGQKPYVAVGGGVDYAKPNPRIFPRQDVWRTSWDAGINVTWALFDGGRTRAEVAEAASLERATRERLNELDSVITVEVEQRAGELRGSVAAIAAAEASVRSAEEARRVVTDRFSAGVATSSDVLDAQVALLQAELDRTQALANQRLSAARLARAMGR